MWCCDETRPGNLPLSHFLLRLSQVSRDGVQLPPGSLSLWNEFLSFTIPSIQIPHWPDTGIARKLSRGQVCLILGGKDVRRTASRDAVYQRYMWMASLTSRHFQSLSGSASQHLLSQDFGKQALPPWHFKVFILKPPAAVGSQSMGFPLSRP